MWDFPWLRPAATQPPPTYKVLQIVVATSLTALIGCTLQVVKLGALDSSSRTFLQSSYAGKMGFLAAFGFSKATANLSVGLLVEFLGRKWTCVVGWVVAMAIPVLVSTAAASARGWANVVAANVFLGLMQGLCWSVTVLLMIELFPSHQRGLAVGLNETTGYTAIAIFAPIYGAMEHHLVHCSWKTGSQFPATLTEECQAASGGACDSADTWTAACLGACTCQGYTHLIAYSVLLLASAGFVVSLLLLRNTIPVARHRNKTAGSKAPAKVSPASASAYLPLEEATEVDDQHRAVITGDHHTSTWDKVAPLETVGLLQGTSSNSTLASQPSASLSQQFGRLFVKFTWQNKSTAVMCLAGFMSNVLTSLAWGLILTWARDALHIPGPGRNVLTASYSFLKGLVQLFTGMLSDITGRKVLVSLGLLANTAGLLTAACGSGFGGRLLGPDVTTGSMQIVQFGYLMVAGCLMGLGTGMMYPVMAAAIADHSTVQTQAMGMATYRFWRDMGYAAGAVAGVVADASGAEAAMVVFAVLSAGVAGLVMFMFLEQSAGDGSEGT